MNQKTPEACDLFRQAVRFLTASEVIESSVIKELSNQDVTYGQIFIVCIVNLSFACELMLKAAIKSETGKNPFGHKLQNLFKYLSRPTQDLIIAELEIFSKPNATTFEQRLALCDQAFIEWRYLHEFEIGRELKFEHAFIKSLVYLLERQLALQNPGWQLPYRIQRHS